MCVLGFEMNYADTWGCCVDIRGVRNVGDGCSLIILSWDLNGLQIALLHICLYMGS